MRKQIFFLILGGILVLSFAQLAEAQYLREGGYFFLQGRGGLSAYFGDRTSENSQWSLVSYAVDGGLGFNFSPHWSIAATYRRAEYPRIRQIPFKEYWFARKHTANLYIRYTFKPNSTLSPYVLAGGGATMWGTYDGLEDRPGYGPIIGAGLDYALSEHFFLFLEATSDLVLDDEAVDGLSGSPGFDALGVFAGGIRIFLKPRFRPVEWASITGPTELRTGEQGTYRVAVNEKATTPVEYRWNFGDGTTAQGMGVTKTFDEPGVYTVQVTAANRRTQVTESIRVTVTDPPIPAQIVSIDFEPVEPRPHDKVRFTARVRGSEPINYTWDFGDGTTSHELHTQHAYARAGDYNVTLTVDNTEVAGEEGVDSRTINISVREPEIILELDAMLHFNFDSAVLRPEARPVLDEVVEILHTDTDIILAEVAGHTCDIGTAEYNKGLSERRARAVANYLIEKGIDEDRLVVIGYGEERPKVPNISIENRQQNRRVVITVKERD